MKMRTAAAVLALATLVSGCGAEDSTTTGTPAPSSPSQESPSEEASTPARGEGKSDRSPSKEASGAGGEGTQVLIGTVGEAEDPEAFTIALADSSGEPVTTLEAGQYQVKVSDLATLHNFHLTGPGVDESTSVSGTGEVTWNVTLEPGGYSFVCDPHPEMRGDVKVV
jgi:plastocyanin